MSSAPASLSIITLPRLRRGGRLYEEAIVTARSVLTERVRHFAALGGYRYGRLAIRNQKTRWGSCSHPERGLCTLSFNYRLIYLPPALLDYVVVHELAHTRQPNHSPQFWAEVARFVPEWKGCRRMLRAYRW